MNPIEIIALIFALAVLIKTITFIFIDPKSSLKLAEKIWKKTGTILPSIFFIILLVILSYFLLIQLTIVQIFAASLFGIALYKLLLAQYPKPFLRFAQEVLKNKQKLWLPGLIWIILALWVLYMVLV